jgi:peptidoglycan/xylan/chitin deacetylase (PgdA/CDA1 family)
MSLPLWKSSLLHAYYRATLPLRWYQERRDVACGAQPLIVLCYHRVADDRANPWTVSNRLFDRQIAWLQRHFEFISLDEVQTRIRTGANHGAAVSITFDDGYSENCQHAIPLLVAQKIPCTYFVTLRNLMDGEPFAHDVAQGNRFPPNDMEQLRAMAAAGIEIGAHSYSHPDLGKITDARRLYFEVVTAGENLQAALGRTIRYFAFPYGLYAHLNREACHMAYDAGYEAVCSAYGGFNYPGGDAYHLQRIPVDDDMIRLKNWVTRDPRKSMIPRFVWEGATTPPVRRRNPVS